MEKKTTSKIALACLSLELTPDRSAAIKQVPTEIQLTPAGYFRAVDGRPHDAPDGWFIDEMQARLVKLAARRSRNKFVIDYEHQTLHKEKNGQPAPAAGWFKKLEWREGSGLWAVDVKWTPQAESAILSEQYLYLSPVFQYEPQTGRVLSIQMAAITNSPGLDGMQSLASLSLEQFQTLLTQQEDMPMKKLLAMLGLPDTASEEEAVAALTKLQSENKESSDKVAALTAQVDAEPDPAKYVPVAVVQGLKAEMAALTQSHNTKTVEDLVGKALEDKLITAAEKDWALKLGKTNLAALTGYLGTQKPIAALTAPQVTPGEAPPGKTAALTAEQKQAAQLLGIPEEEYLAHLKSEQGA